MDKPVIEQVQPVDTVPVIVSEFYLIGEEGDSSLVRNWSDGVIDTVFVNNN